MAAGGFKQGRSSCSFGGLKSSNYEIAVDWLSRWDWDEIFLWLHNFFQNSIQDKIIRYIQLAYKR